MFSNLFVCVCKQAKNVQRCQHVWVYPFVSAQRVREENGIDPNRDFPYSKPATHCMETAVARAINELWREHVFQLAITFHGGMQVGPQRCYPLQHLLVPFVDLGPALRPGHRRLPMSGVRQTMSPTRPSRQMKWPRHSLARS